MSVESPTASSSRSGTKEAAPSAGLTRPFETAAAAVRAHPLASFLIGFGIILRVGRYFQDRSLWLDEASLAVNLISRSYSGLFRTLDFDQGAPYGFLVLEKLAISTFGDSERAFRLFPLLTGIASLFVFWRVASRFLGRSAALLALAFFTVLEPLVYYSSETKPYSFDVLVALVLVWLFDRALSTRRLRPLVAYAVAALAAPWFSYPSVFVLAGTGGALLLVAAIERDWRTAAFRAAVVAGGAVIFLVVYLTSIRHLSGGLKGTAEAVTSSGHSSVAKNIYVLLSDPGAMPRTLIGLAVFLVAIGAVIMARQRWPRLAALVLIVVAAGLAAEIHRYPLVGRLALFLVPLVLLLLALGAVTLVRSTPAAVRGVVFGAVLLLLAAPFWTGLRHLRRPPTAQAGTPATLQPTRHLLARLADAWRPGDTLYVSIKSQLAFRYYLTCHDCNPHGKEEARLWPFEPVNGPTQTSQALRPERPSLVVGSPGGALESYLDDFDRLVGKRRVWFLFTHTPPVDEQALEFSLDRQGRQVSAFREGTAVVLLYDLRRKGRSTG